MLQEITLRTIEDFFQHHDDIIDELGTIDKQIKELESAARRIKGELIARGIGKYAGANYIAEVQHYDRATISPKLVRELIDPELVQAVTETKAVDAVVVRPL